LLFSYNEFYFEKLQYSGNLALSKKGVNLAKGLIGLKKLHNLNLSTSSCGKIVKCVEFHATSSLALIAGISGRASIVQVGIGQICYVSPL